MRIGRFESAGRKPISKTATKETYVDPVNAQHSVAVLKEKDPGFYKKREENDEKKSPRTLKGAFYLTKIAHLLLPQQVPDIHQAGETVDGQQTVDRDRNAPVKLMRRDVGEVDSELKRIGLGSVIDPKINNYTKGEEGDILYLDEFIPWNINTTDRALELRFDRDVLATAIEELSDESLKKECSDFLERVLVLFEEEKAAFNALECERRAAHEATLVSLETALDSFEKKHNLEILFGLQTEDEARQSPERQAAKEDQVIIFALTKNLNHSYMSVEDYVELNEKLKKLKKIDQAIGTIAAGRVNHTR